MTQEYRIAAAEAAKPVMQALNSADRAIVECYANSEFWAGWNAAVAHASKIALNRYKCWQESTIGSSQPECDVSACEDISLAISFETHGKPPVSRPLALSRATGK